MVSAWIGDENLRPFLEVAAGLVGSWLDEADWAAITTELESDPSGEVRQASYVFQGDTDLKIRLSHERGESAITFEADAPEAVERRIEGAAAVLADYSAS